jgi:hypothetical protein
MALGAMSLEELSSVLFYCIGETMGSQLSADACVKTENASKTTSKLK